MHVDALHFRRQTFIYNDFMDMGIISQ